MTKERTTEAQLSKNSKNLTPPPKKTECALKSSEIASSSNPPSNINNLHKIE